MQIIQNLVCFVITAIVLLSDSQLEWRHVQLQSSGANWMVTAAIVWILAVLLFLNHIPVFRRWFQQLFPGKKSRAEIPPRDDAKHLPCLLVFIFLILLSHVLDAPQSAQGLRVRTLFGSMMFGQLALLTMKDARTGNFFRPKFIWMFSIGLAIAVLSQFSNQAAFSYRGHARWTGLWQNPNTFGLMMAAGLLLALGQIMAMDLNQKNAAGKKIGLGLIALLTTIGLLESYSRGAWVGTVVGLIYFLYLSRDYLARRFPVFYPWIQRNRITLGLVGVSVAALAWWGFHEVDWGAARRVVSVSNPNDFSWRNRVNSWIGGLQMMADKPLLGYGWREPDSVYAQFYRTTASGERDPSILFNDYIVLGLIFGMLALFSFLAYFCDYFSAAPIQQQTDTAEFSLTSSAVLQNVSRVMVVVMLIGFFFDGGLFKIGPAVTFWVLVEMGRKS